MMSDKKILLRGIDCSDVAGVERFFTANRLFNACVDVNPRHLTKELVQTLNVYGMEVLVNLNCIENGNESLSAVLKDNPEFQAVFETLSGWRGKLYYHYTNKESRGADSIIALALTFANKRLFVIGSYRDTAHYDTDRRLTELYINDVHENTAKIDYISDLSEVFNVVDINLLRQIVLSV